MSEPQVNVEGDRERREEGQWTPTGPRRAKGRGVVPEDDED